ncbi:hypothetical protein BGZ49_009274 [Haplosporangium sp. Z 27]|nr:hypothetical protein BGZ49_009274 [Haplosporangium sp. Z 27]
MALIQSLAVSAAGSRLLRDENDTLDQVAARGISYILFYAIFGNLIRWSYGFNLLVPKDTEEQTTPNNSEELTIIQNNQETLESREHLQPINDVVVNVDEPQTSLPEQAAVISSASSMRTLIIPFTNNNSEQSDDDDLINKDSQDYSRFFRVAHKSKIQQQSTHMHQLASSATGSTRSPSDSISIQQRRRNSHHQHHSTKTLIKQKAYTVFERLRKVMTPPLLTAIIALIIGLIPALHKFFMSPDSKFYSFIIHPIEGCGEAAIPMILLCLGSQVVHFATSSKPPKDKPKSEPLTRPKQLERRRSHTMPAVFPHADQSSDSSSSDGDEQDQGWLRVQPTSRKPLYRHGRNPSLPSRVSPPTLYERRLSDDDDINLPNSAFNGASELGLRSHRFKWLTPIVYSLFSRMLLVPLICLPLILFQPSSLSPALTMDPAFSLTLVLIAASPTAINMIQLCQIKGFFEHDMAAVLFWSYCVLGIPCILGWSLVGLWAAERF